jgi:transcriptional antiterminator
VKEMNSRQIKFLKLLQQQSEYKPASFFAKWLSVSTKTIYSDVNVLYDILKSNGITLDSSPRIGIKVNGSSAQLNAIIEEMDTSDKIDIFAPAIRRLNIIKMIVLEDQTLNLDDLSDKYLVSKTSIYQDLVTINNVFEAHDVRLQVTNHGIVLEGRENDIQIALKEYIFDGDCDGSLLDLKQFLTTVFNKEDIDEIFNLLLDDYDELTHDVSIYYIKSIIVTLLIQLARLRINHHLESEDTFLFNNIQYMETYIVANSIVEILKQYADVEFNNTDVEYLCRQLFAHRITNNLKSNSKNYSDIVNEIIKIMSKIEKVDLTHDEHLYKSLVYHVPAMIVRLQKGIQIINPLLDSIKRQYSELFSIVWYALSIIETTYDVSLNDHEVSLMLIHFQIALDKISKANNILIVCPYGVSSSQLIMSKVKQLLPSKDNIELAKVDTLYTTDLSNVSLIITSTELKNIDVPYVKVTPLVTNEDYKNIMDAYAKHILFKEEIMKKLADFQAPYLSRFIKPSLIRVKEEYQTKEECLNAMIDILEEKDYVTDKFRESIHNREKVGVTCMDSGVALPHAEPSTIKTSCVSIQTLKTPINWGGNMVNLIIMVCLNEEEVGMFKSVIQELYSIIVKKEYIDQIVKLDSVDSIIRLFYKK